MTTAVYIRVSTASQNTAGQRAEIERWLTGHNITGATFYVDKASGNSLKRLQFDALQKAIFNGEVKTVVIWKLDRLSRNLRDGINVLADWCDKGIRVVSVTQQLDFTQAMGKLLASVFLAVAEMEQETRKERQAIGIKEAKKAGIYKGRSPGSLKSKPSEAIRLRAQGLTIAQVAASLKISERTAHRYLSTHE